MSMLEAIHDTIMQFEDIAQHFDDDVKRHAQTAFAALLQAISTIKNPDLH
jgi:ABC-type polysaccharide/polyol phosphate transport system ATPase subunit